ncbi:MAG: serine phosphatase RsbU, regulator of sigma subunit [Frankiales bacterium]|nr:serine phosphatase RsbU, regulator of sigma subunit [Frankiales bacterium]
MSAELVLPPDVTSVGVSRRFVRSTLAEWHLDGLADTAVLLTSEVVTNSVLHARTEILLSIDRTAEGCVTISVHDGSPHQPRARSHSVDATTGRGMELLERLSQEWHIDNQADGKTLVFTVGGADPWAAFTSINWSELEADL